MKWAWAANNHVDWDDDWWLKPKNGTDGASDRPAGVGRLQAGKVSGAPSVLFLNWALADWRWVGL